MMKASYRTSMHRSPKHFARRECANHPRKRRGRDRTGWLGREDSNLGITGVAHMLTATTTADSHSSAEQESSIGSPQCNSATITRAKRMQALRDLLSSSEAAIRTCIFRGLTL